MADMRDEPTGNGIPPLMATAQMNRLTAPDVVMPMSSKTFSATLRFFASTRAVIMDVITPPVCQDVRIVSQFVLLAKEGDAIFGLFRLINISGCEPMEVLTEKIFEKS